MTAPAMRHGSPRDAALHALRPTLPDSPLRGISPLNLRREVPEIAEHGPPGGRLQDMSTNGPIKQRIQPEQLGGICNRRTVGRLAADGRNEQWRCGKTEGRLATPTILIPWTKNSRWVVGCRGSRSSSGCKAQKPGPETTTKRSSQLRTSLSTASCHHSDATARRPLSGRSARPRRCGTSP